MERGGMGDAENTLAATTSSELIVIVVLVFVDVVVVIVVVGFHCRLLFLVVAVG